MEDGIADAGGVMNITATDDGAQYIMDKTFAEIKAALIAGLTIILTSVRGSEELGYTTLVGYITGYEETGNPQGEIVSRNIFTAEDNISRYTADSDDGYPYYYYD